MKPGSNKTGLPQGEERNSYWSKWYITVIVFLLVQVTLYYFITQYFK